MVIKVLRRILTAFTVALLIPAAGYWTADWILGEISGDSAIRAVVSRCAGAALLERGGCSDILRLVLLRDGSFWSGVVAFDLMLLYFVTALVAGRDRRLNAAIFPLLIPISLLVISVLVFLQGAILTYGVAALEIHLIGRLHFWLVGLLGLGSLVGGAKLVWATVMLCRRPASGAFAQEITEQQAPVLWRFIGEIAQSIGAKKPENVIVGLEPTFYATAADVDLINRDLRIAGETLYLSLPLMRLFNLDELRAVIGHELGHFRGADTAYSLKFAPVYTGLSHALDLLHDEEKGADSLAQLPAISMLSLMLEMFARNERRISRDREFEADAVGVSVAGPEALATSLGKVAVYAPLWDHVREENVNRLNLGKVELNISKAYEDWARNDVSHKAVGSMMRELLTTEIAHPTDTHPTVEARFRNIGFDPDMLTVEKLTSPGGAGDALLPNMAPIERELTVEEHRLMVLMGHADPPGGVLRKIMDLPAELTGSTTRTTAPKDDPIYTLGAALINADGAVTLDEVTVAEQAGARLMTGFDGTRFRECCNSPATLPDFRATVDKLAIEMPHERRREIYDYLKGIAMADGEVPQSERDLLLYVRERWSI